MHITRLLLATFMTVFTVLSSQPASASAKTLLFAGKQTKLAFTGITAKASKSPYGGIMVHVLDASGKPLNMFLQSSGREAARKFGPREIAKAMTLGKVTASTIKRWPIETFGFAMAIGAINSMKLFFDYSANPVAMEQHLDMQKDPVGHVGFLAFMLANGTSAHLMNQVFGEKKLSASRFRHFVPFMGMGIGMVASNIVHEIGHFPSLKECALGMPGSKEKELACDKAYEAWLDLDFAEKGHEWAPGLISLFASFAISGAVTWAASSVLKVVGIEIAMLLTPGGAYVKAMKAAMWFVNMTLFVGIDELIRNMIMTPYRNWNLANKVEEHETNLYKELIAQKKNGWTGKNLAHYCYTTKYDSLRDKLGYDSGEYCKTDFNGTVHKMSETLNEWREFNLEPVTMAHANWKQHLNNLSSMYGGAKEFYSYFLNQVQQKHFGRYSKNKNFTFPMDRQFPLHGIRPARYTNDDRKLFLEDPAQIVEFQLEAVAQAVSQLDEMTAELLSVLNSTSQKELLSVISDLSRGQEILIGKTIDRMRASIASEKTEKALKHIYTQFLNHLGKPKPLWIPGQGFAEYYRIHPTLGANYQYIPYASKYGILETKTLAESMWAAMVYGPDVEKGHETISGVIGFKSHFSPPRVAFLEGSFMNSTPPQQVERQNLKFNFYGMMINSGTGPTMKTHSNIFDFLSAAHIRSTVVNATNGSPAQWWSKYPETDYYNALLDYEEKYQQIIVELQERMWRKDLTFWGVGRAFLENLKDNPKDWFKPFAQIRMIREWAKGPTAFGFTKEDGDSRFNDGPVSNGVMEAFDQQKKMYLLVAGEMYKDLFTAQNNMNNLMIDTAYTNSFVTQTALVADADLAKADKNSTTIPILRMLRYGDTLQLAALSSGFPKLTDKKDLGKFQSSNLKWQEKITASIESVQKLLEKIQVRDIRDDNGKLITVSSTHVSTAKITEAKEKAMAEIREVRAQVEGSIKMTPFQKSVMEACFTGLDNVLNDMATLGAIANAVSYIEVKNKASGASSWAPQTCEKTKRKVNVGGIMKLVESCL